MAAPDSCLITKLSHYVEITDEQKHLLSSIESASVTMAANTEVHAAGDSVDALHVLQSGWLFG